MTLPSAVEVARGRRKARRWVQLVIGVVCMVMIANLQYGWTLFVTPLGEKYQWSRQAIQVAFTVFVATETWLVPVEGYLVDRFGPRMVTIAGGVLVAAGWSINSIASTLPLLYVGQAIGGIGAGAVYGTCVGNALKWFPDRRGLAAGITAAGFGAGSALTVVPIASMIESSGYESTFLYFGLGQGLVVFALGWLLAQPDASVVAALPRPATAASTARQIAPLEMIRTPVFWLMYVMFVLMAAGGLFVTANLKQVAEDFKVASTQVSLLGITLPAATFALSLDRVLNGFTRPFFGWVSDKLGRENTMFIAFLGEAIGILLLSRAGHNPVLFVMLSGLVFFAWGEIYSLFPSTSADTYGWKHAAANAGILYTAKGTAALLVPIATTLAVSAGWNTVFLTSAAMNLAAAILALLVLKPMRRRMQEQT
ncbi:MAG TPA: oxalate/formate MFS antiporter [Kofleriaceae bacterium]|nr:oxalate/formate MFS antiporter [Kofleriaceae bacterium]